MGNEKQERDAALWVAEENAWAGQERKQSPARRTLEELNVLDDFMMNAAAADGEAGENFCRTLLSTLLERQIGRVTVNVQKVIPALTPELRGIRMDVEIREEAEPVARIYDLEPCRYRKQGLERANRFQQARIDSRYVRSGEKDFHRMPNLYVLTILPYDPFGEDYMVYHVHNHCEEVPALDYPDGLEYIYFYTKGTKGGNPEIQRMLHYIEDSREENVRDEAVRELHRHVRQVRLRPEVKEEYMLWEEKIYYERQEAAEEAAKVAAQRATKEAQKAQQIQDICDLLEDYGTIPDTLKKRLEEETDPATLKRWHKLAARAGSLDDFIKQINVKE